MDATNPGKRNLALQQLFELLTDHHSTHRPRNAMLLFPNTRYFDDFFIKPNLSLAMPCSEEKAAVHNLHVQTCMQPLSLVLHSCRADCYARLLTSIYIRDLAAQQCYINHQLLSCST